MPRTQTLVINVAGILIAYLVDKLDDKARDTMFEAGRSERSICRSRPIYVVKLYLYAF
jgi:hypothetical protein